MRYKLIGPVTICAITASTPTYSALHIREVDGNISNGYEAIYDDVLNITWLADANLMASNSFGLELPASTAPQGMYSWFIAMDWIDAMNNSNHLGYNQWRLPSASPVNGVNFQILPVSYDGSTDQAFNIGAPDSAYPDHTGSELAHMFFRTLGNVAARDINGNANSCITTTCLSNTDPFINLISEDYWTQTSYDDNTALNFQMVNGAQNFPNKSGFDAYAWAVADGDPFAVVPLPATAWLFLSAVGGLISVTRFGTINSFKY